MLVTGACQVKAVVGIDLEQNYSSAISLLGRLNFGITETTLLHVTEPYSLTLPYSAYGVLVEADEFLAKLKESAVANLAAAEAKANEFGLNPKTRMEDGFPIRSLIDFADDSAVDLICVTSTISNTLGAVFGGSVARGLAIAAKHSILVARESELKNGPLKIVFAVDQSEYCNLCLDLLVKWAPKGISEATILTVVESKSDHRHLFGIGHSHQSIAPDHSSAISENGERLARKLIEFGIPTHSKVVIGGIDVSIHQAMVESGADLLVMGSPGHSFVDRVISGSVSLHEVIFERYPVLLLRPV